MTLTVADIDRWSAEQVREVFHAGSARGQATLEASRQLSTLTDCATAQQMWTFYQSQMVSERSAALESAGDNAGTAVKYQHMINELQAYADRITTPDIRRRADRMVAINHEMFEQWKAWGAQSPARSSELPTPISSDKQFGNRLTASARKLKPVHAELTAACPN